MATAVAVPSGGVRAGAGPVASGDRALQDHVVEMRAREASLDTTMALTSGNAVRRPADDLARHFASDGFLLIRKALIARVEGWLGPSARPRRQPFRSAARVFDRWTNDGAATARAHDRWLLAGLWLALAGRAIALPLMRGVTTRRCAYAIAVQNKWGPRRAGAQHHDLFAVDQRMESCDIAVLASGDAFVHDYEALGHPVIQVGRARVSLTDWAGDVLPRVLRLSARRLTDLPRGAAAWLASFAAWEVAWRSIDWEVVAGTTRIRVITDVEEQNPEHAIKTAVFGRRGGRTVRIPHTQPDTPGNHTAFWMYHVAAVSNAYLPRVYGGTWWDATEVRPVGLIFNASQGEERNAAIDRLDAIASRGPIMVLFTGSDVGVQPLIHDALMRITLRALDAYPQLHLVVKPKPSHTGFLESPPHRLALAQLESAGRVTVLKPSELWCGAQPLLKRSTLCLTYGGSVVTEALALRKPMIVYSPVPAHRTQWVDVFADSIIAASEDDAAERIAAVLERRAPQIPEQLLRENCDEFLDDGALSRFTDLVHSLVTE